MGMRSTIVGMAPTKDRHVIIVSMKMMMMRFMMMNKSRNMVVEKVMMMMKTNKMSSCKAVSLTPLKSLDVEWCP